MGASGSKESIPDPPPRLPVPEGKTRICLAGFKKSHNVGRAVAIVRAIVEHDPVSYESWFFLDEHAYRGDKNSRFLGRPKARGGFLKAICDELAKDCPDLDADMKEKLKTHMSAPFVWVETASGKQPLGGRDDLCSWSMNQGFAEQASIKPLITTPPGFGEANFDAETPGTAATS